MIMMVVVVVVVRVAKSRSHLLGLVLTGRLLPLPARAMTTLENDAMPSHSESARILQRRLPCRCISMCDERLMNCTNKQVGWIIAIQFKCCAPTSLNSRSLMFRSLNSAQQSQSHHPGEQSSSVGLNLGSLLAEKCCRCLRHSLTIYVFDR